MSATSPFTISRFEYERKHLYFLPSKVMAELESSSPIYLVGSRGTGKTTLLKALTASERLRNVSLQRQLEGDPFANRFLGVYFKLPGIQLQLLDDWLANTGEHIHGWCVGLFLDLIWIELVLESMADLIAEKVLLISPSEEHECVVGIVNNNPGVLSEYLGSNAPFTLNDLSNAVKCVKRRLEKAALHRLDWHTALEGYPTGQIGHFGKQIGGMLSTLCDRNLTPDQDPWRFMICMDEAECLTKFQQKVLNTFVRLTEWPVFPVVAFVSLPEDTTHTLIPNLTLQKADRKLHTLDNMTDSEFKELAEGVASTRVRIELVDDTTRFSVDRVFGSLNINGLLLSILNESVRPKAKELLAAAKRLLHTPFFTEEGQSDFTDDIRSKSPPIYQAFLIEQLRLPIPSPADEAWQRRRQDSAELRKRMVAAYLTICHTLGTNIRYASGEMLLQMSDKCIRDFLSQTQEVFVESKKSLAEFLETPLPALKQDNALRRASIAKRDSLSVSGVPSPPKTARIVYGLAKLTAIVQTRGRNNQHLRSSERGIFNLKVGVFEKQQYSNELKLLIDAAEAGFLKIIDTEGASWLIRVHASLAAAYGFSYRGAYYPIQLELKDVQRLSELQDSERLEQLIEEIGTYYSGQDADDMPLFNHFHQ